MDNQPAFLTQPSAQEEQKKGLFNKKDAKATGIDINQISNELNNISRRLRVLEERYINLRTKTQVTDQNMLLNNKKLITQINMIGDETKEVKREMKEVRDTMKLMIKELRETVKKEEMNTIKKYIDLWDPSNFITRDGVRKMFRELIDEFNEEKSG